MRRETKSALDLGPMLSATIWQPVGDQGALVLPLVGSNRA
jgi:hypothetical protein